MRGFDPKWQDVPHFIIGIIRAASMAMPKTH